MYLFSGFCRCVRSAFIRISIKVILCTNIIISRVINIRWYFVSAKNKIYWYFYKKTWFPYCESVYKNLSHYFQPFSNALVNLVLRKKTIVVFLLVKSHYGWVDQVLQKLNSCKVAIQIFSPDESLRMDRKAYKAYTMAGLNSVRGVNFVPSLMADLFITPASTTADNAPLGTPKLMMMHSLVSIPGVYEENTFDGYDYIYCAGKHHLAELKAIYQEKGLTGKCLIPGGYPKLDELMLRAASLGSPVPKTIIIAPTLVSPATEHVSLMSQMSEFIDYFLSNGWVVTFRPHPLNLSTTNVYYAKFNEVIQSYPNNPNFTLDTSSDYFVSYANASVMLSDISGTAYTYTFAFGRPVLFFDPEVPSEFAQGLLYHNREKMGRSVRSVNDLQSCISNFVEDYVALKVEVESFRNDVIFNLGNSANYFVDNLDYILKRKKHPAWTYV